jgi:arylsulfatase
MGYTKWRAEHAYAILPFAGYVGQHLATYVAFPPRQKAGTFGLEQVLEKLQQGGEK